MTNLTPLDNFQLERVSASIVLDTRRPKSSGDYPVKYRVTFMKKQQYYPCMDLSPEEYRKLHGAVRDLYLKKTKKLILDGFNRITALIEVLVNTDGFTFEGLARRLKRGTGDSILHAFDNRIAALKEKGKIGSSVWYSCAKNSIVDYDKKDLKFADISPTWLEKYQEHLLKEGKKKTTVSMYQRALRAIINEGMRDGIISPAQYPFVIKENGKYKIPKGSGRKIALSEAQLIEVFNYPIIPDDEKWRDLWVFSFYCNGANINDILRFKYKDIIGDIIAWDRQKTKDTSDDEEKIKAIINDEMKRIIKLYGNPEKSTNYIFPYLSQGLGPVREREIIQNVTHNINKKMKKIGRGLGYGDITTYWARHSWASISQRKGTSVFTISKGLGHHSIKTTEKNYLPSISVVELEENAAKMPVRTFNNK